MLALPLSSSPLTEMQELNSYRSPMLSSLSDLSLSNQDAISAISQKVASIFHLPVDPSNKNFWFDLLSKTASPPTGVSNAEQISSDLRVRLEQGFTGVKSAVTDFNQKHTNSKEDASEARNQLVFEQYGGLIKEVGEALTQKLEAEKIRQFFELYKNTPEEEKNMEVHSHIAEELNEIVLAQINSFIEDSEIEFTQELLEEYQNSIYDVVAKVYGDDFRTLAEYLHLCVRSAYYMRIETAYLYNAIQHYSETPVEHRLSRMTVVLELFFPLSHSNDASFELEDFNNRLYTTMRLIVRGEAEEDVHFTPVYREIVKRFLGIYNEKVNSEISFKWARKYFTLQMGIRQNHLTPFLRQYVAENKLPLLSESDSSRNAAQKVRIIDCLAALEWSEVTPEWWTSVLTTFDRLMGVDSRVIEMNAHSTLLFMEGVTPLADHHEFFGTLYNILLEFTELNGNDVSYDNYNAYFDGFINHLAATNPLVQKYYLQLKLQNVYTSSGEKPFEVVFNKGIDSQAQADSSRAFFDSHQFSQLRSLLWNGYSNAFNDKKKSSFESNLFLLKTSGASISSVHFPKGEFSFTVSDKIVHKSREGNYAEFTMKFPSFQRATIGGLVKKDDGKDNKIVVDEEEEDMELPALTRKNAEMVSDIVKEVVTQMVEEKKQDEKIEQQVNEIMTDKEQGEEMGGDLSAQERKLLQQDNLLEILRSMSELVNEDGSVARFVYTKVVPNKSECFNSIFE